MNDFFKKLSKHMFGKLPDGRPTYGFGTVVLVVGVPFLAIVFFVRNSSNPARETRGVGVDTPRVDSMIQSGEPAKETLTASAVQTERTGLLVTEAERAADQTAAKIEEGERSSRSNRSAIDSVIADASKEIEKERPVVVDDSGFFPGSSRAAAGSDPSLVPPAGSPSSHGIAGIGGIPSGMGGSSGSNSGANPGNPGAFVVYRRKDLDPPAASEVPAPALPAKPTTPTYVDGKFLPRAHEIVAYTLDAIRTDQPQPLIRLGVAQDVIFRSKVVVPFGTMIIGTATGAPAAGNRVPVAVNALQWTDGSEVALSAVVKGLDGAAGVPGYYIPTPAMVHVGAIGTRFVEAYMDLLYARRQQSLSVQIGGATVGTSPGSTVSPENEALAATSDTIKTYLQSQLKEVQQRNAPYFVIPAGTKVKLQLLNPLSITSRAVGAAGVMSTSPSPVTGSDAAANSGAGPADAMAKLQEAITNAASTLPGTSP